MDKYEDLGLEASKFIEDLNMYEASRDGLFRTRRDAGNNPDFEETRKVFASKMTKIHMQKHQEEMARNNQAIRMNGGHNSAYYTKDRPPINSSRQPGEAAAKPPILSGPVPATAAGSQYPQLDGQKHHTAAQPEPQAGRAYGYGNSYDNKERSEPHTYQQTPPNQGNASHSAPTPARHIPSQTAARAPSSESHFPPSQQQPPQRQPVPPSSNTGPPQQTPAPSANWGSPSSARGWEKPDLIPTLPLSAFTGGADLHMQQRSPQSAAHYSPSPLTSRPSTNHNGSVSASPLLPASAEATQPKTQSPSSASVPGIVSKGSSQLQQQNQIPGRGNAASAETEVPRSPKPTQQLSQSPVMQPPEPTAAEIKLEALTNRLEKEMDTQPKADYFGKMVSTTPAPTKASVS